MFQFTSLIFSCPNEQTITTKNDEDTTTTSTFLLQFKREREREGQGRLKTLGNNVRHLRVVAWQKMNPPHFFVPMCVATCCLCQLVVNWVKGVHLSSVYPLQTREREALAPHSLSLSLSHTHSSGIVLKSLHQCLERLHAFFCRSLVSVRKSRLWIEYRLITPNIKKP